MMSFSMPSQMSCPESFYGWNPKQPSENPLCTSDSKSLPKCLAATQKHSQKEFLFRNFYFFNIQEFFAQGKISVKCDSVLNIWKTATQEWFAIILPCVC